MYTATMSNFEEKISFSLACKKTLNVILGNRKPFIHLVMLGLVLPFWLFQIVMAFRSEVAVKALRVGFSKEAQDFEALLQPVSDFLSGMLPFMLIVLATTGCTVFALTRLALAYKGQEAKELSAARFLQRGFGDLFPRGFLICFGVLLVTLEQLIFGPIRIFTMFALVAPVLLITEGQGVLRSFYSAVSLQFVDRSVVGRLAVAITLIGLGAALFLGETLIRSMVSYLFELEHVLGFSSSILHAEISSFSMTYAQALTTAAGSLLQGFALGFVAIFVVEVFRLSKSEEEVG